MVGDDKESLTFKQLILQISTDPENVLKPIT